MYIKPETTIIEIPVNLLCLSISDTEAEYSEDDDWML